MAASKEIMEVVTSLQKKGWRVRLGKHIVLYPADPRYKPVCISYTPSDGRWWNTMKTKLNRAGANIH